MAHSASHAHTFSNMLHAAGADCSRHAGLIFVAVRSRVAVKTMSLNHALKTLTFGPAGNIHHIARGKLGNVQSLSDAELAFNYFKLFQVPQILAHRFQVTC